MSNLHIYAAMRGQSLEDFQKTRNAQVLYSVAGKDAGKKDWDKQPAEVVLQKRTGTCAPRRNLLLCHPLRMSADIEVPSWQAHGGKRRWFTRSTRARLWTAMAMASAICPASLGNLDYLAALGVDAIWLSPIYPSPMADFGYDVADYTGIHPLFGTLADFDTLLAEAHARGLKVMLDFVPNHSSDRASLVHQIARVAR